MNLHRAGELLDAEMATLWLLDERSRLVGYPPPLDLASPLVVVAANLDACRVAVSTTVDDVLASLVHDLVGPARADRIGWEPANARAIEALLPAPGRARGGPSYLVTELVPTADEGVRTSQTSDLDALAGLMPEADRGLRAPWSVVIRRGEVAAVCETSRSAASAVEAGVWTYPAHRGQGLAQLATSAWAGLVADQLCFYSTASDNLASIGVARSLGLRPVGHWWIVEPA